VIRIFRALDWLPSISGSEIMAQKSSFWQISQKVYFAFSGQIFASHT